MRRARCIAQVLLAKIAAFDLVATADSEDPLVWQWLQAKGIDYAAALAVAGPLVRRMVTFLDGGRFEFSALGETAFVQIVAGGDAETPIDLLAWSPFEPGRFGTLLSGAPILGVDQTLNLASFAYGPCRLWRHPLRWLKEQCLGAVILDPGRARPILDRAPGAFAAEDLEHGRELLASLAVHRDRLFIPDHRAGRGAA